MENASKALLIAGAILIAILLIAIGMMVFNSANGVIDTASSGMTDHEKTLHNKKFSVYEGKQSGAVVKEVFEIVNANNTSENPIPMRIRLIKKAGGAAAAYLNEGWQSNYNIVKGLINDGGFYMVKCEDTPGFKDNENKDGIISRVEVTEL